MTDIDELGTRIDAMAARHGIDMVRIRAGIEFRKYRECLRYYVTDMELARRIYWGRPIHNIRITQADAELEISDQQREKAWREQSLDSLMAQTKAIITAGMKN